MPNLWIENKALSWERIKAGDFFNESFSAYSLQTLNFAQKWLWGEKIFELQSSGSTGKAKKISITKEQMQYSALQTQKFFDLKAKQKVLVCLNTNYIAGIMMLVRAFEIGWEMWVIPPQSNPLKTLYKDFKKPPSQLDFTALVPLQLQTMISDKNTFPLLENLKLILLGGASVNYSLNKKIKDLKNKVFIGYGMTETVSHIALRALNGEKQSDFYEVLPEVEIQKNESNCLQIKSPVTQNQWLNTNDIVEFSPENKFLVKGRIDNVINSGGLKIQLEELEKAFEEIFFEIKLNSRFFLSGIPDEKLGEKLILLIENNSNSTEKKLLKEQVLNLAQTKLNKYQIPKEICFLEQFEETPTRKIQKKQSLKKTKLI